jgi:hypothetical protein
MRYTMLARAPDTSCSDTTLPSSRIEPVDGAPAPPVEAVVPPAKEETDRGRHETAAEEAAEDEEDDEEDGWSGAPVGLIVYPWRMLSGALPKLHRRPPASTGSICRSGGGEMWGERGVMKSRFVGRAAPPRGPSITVTYHHDRGH